MRPYVQTPTHTLYHARAEDVLDIMPSALVHLYATDPPFHRVKDETWDREHASDAAFVTWCTTIWQGMRRTILPNGSVYWFGYPTMIDRLSVAMRDTFHVLNQIVWDKGNQGRHRGARKESQRRYFPRTERILFAEPYGTDNATAGDNGYYAATKTARSFVFEPLRAYLDGERRRCGIRTADLEDGMARLTGKRYAFKQPQWNLPTREQYDAARILFNQAGGTDDYLKREYDDLKREYDDLKREYDDLKREYDDLKREYAGLRRPMNLTPTMQTTDVWSFRPVAFYQGKHPCEKPADLMAHIIAASSREGDVVADLFCGSGTTGAEAIRLGRRFIGVDSDERWIEHTARRLELVVQGDPIAPRRPLIQHRPTQTAQLTISSLDSQ